MSKYMKFAVLSFVLMAQITAWAQNADNKNIAIKAHANIGLGDAMNIESCLPEINQSSSASEFGVDLGWTFWRKQNHSLELNVGLAYSSSTLKLGIDNLNYSYSASADADMDGDSYTRHYELTGLEQNTDLSRFVIPVYLSYGYHCTNWLKLHVDLGLNFGFILSSKISGMSGTGYCYGVYPKYDNLKIEESYLNDFGSQKYSADMCSSPQTNGLTCSLMAGIGAEFRIYGPLSADLSVRYSAAMNNLYKDNITQLTSYTDVNSPITYTVKDGTRITSLTDYLTSSKLSNLGLNISLIYHF